MSSRYSRLFIIIYFVLDLLLTLVVALLTDLGWLVSVSATSVSLLMVYLTMGQWVLEMASIFNGKVVKQLKCFTTASEGDLFPAGFYGRELALQVENCILSIPFLFAMIMRRDGGLGEKGISVVHDYFHKRFQGSKQCKFFQTDEAYMRSELERCLNLPKLTDYRSPCLNVVKSKLSYEARLELLESLFQTAHATGKVHVEVYHLLVEIAKFLLIKEWDFRTLEFRYGCYQQQEHASELPSVNYQALLLARSYQKLGLTEDASEADVKSAFREQVKSCHPDRIPEDANQRVREEAVQLFRQTTEAYEVICKERGIR